MPHNPSGPQQPVPSQGIGSSIYDWLNKSIIPQEWTEGAQDAIDSPSLERSPLAAQIQGFGAGAIGGLTDLATPLNIGALMLPGGAAARGVRMGAEAAPEAMAGLKGAAQATKPILQDIPAEEAASMYARYRNPQATAANLGNRPLNIPQNPRAQALESWRTAAPDAQQALMGLMRGR
jgi:hypothetical protein